MGFSNPRALSMFWACLLLVMLMNSCNGFYLPVSYVQTYSIGDKIIVRVNFSTSELPLCYNNNEGVKKSADNLSQLLVGDQINYSPYCFRTNYRQIVYLCTTKPTFNERGGSGVKIMGIGITKHTFNEYAGSSFEIIGIWEEGMGVICEAEQKKKNPSFFEIAEFVIDRMVDECGRAFWYTIPNSLGFIFLMAVFVLFEIFRNMRRHLTRYKEELVKGVQLAEINDQKPPRWNIVAGDVFREPDHSKLLCVMVGDGIQIAGMALAVSVGGFMSLITVITIYLFLGIAAGYVAIRLWRTLKGTSEGWRSVSWSVSCFFPGIVSIILTVINIILWSNNGTGTIPISMYFLLLSLWFGISVPLTLLGGFLGTRAEAIEYPVPTNQIPMENPVPQYLSWFFVLGGGIVSLGSIFVSILYILASSWVEWSSYFYESLLISVLLLIVASAEVSVVVTYLNLFVEDWRWWWKAFFASGVAGLFVFLYSMMYLIYDLQIPGAPPFSAVLYLGSSLIMAVAIMLSAGSIGFLVSFYLAHYIFSSLKISKID